MSIQKFVLTAVFLANLSACDWTVSPQPFPVWTPIPSRTPGVVSPTPIILIPSMTATPDGPTLTATAPGTATETTIPSPTLTLTPFQAIQVDILGCNTGIDLSHGMGEVTNAYVILKNIGTLNLPDSCALLRAADEDRVHPDKTVCVADLPAAYEVTLKLTVDSQYRQDTAIQVDATSGGALLMRVDRPSCTDLDVIGPIPGDIGVVKPSTP